MDILKNIKYYHIIKQSGLFDENWFKNKYNLQEGIDFINYYLKYGVEKNLNPSKEFNTTWYLKEYGDVKNSGMNPFAHYIKYGSSEHRLPRPLIPKCEDKFSLINLDYNPCFFKDCCDKINKNEVNIAFFIKNGVENLLPTEYIRLIIPFYHLFLENNFNPYIFNDICEFTLEKLENMDIVIIQRDALSKSSVYSLVELCKINNIKLIYELDDDLINIDKSHPNYEEFFKKKDVFEYLIRNSDVVTVSTLNLKKKLLALNSNIKIIKNTLNDMLNLKNNATKSDVIKIGYMGTLSHKNDIKLIENAIINVKKYFSKKGKKIIFEIIGVSDEKLNYANSINVPFKYSKYPYFIRWLKQIVDWDVAIAPLEYTQFNQSKSEIKYLEYSSLGIPGVYSNMGAYSQIIKNNETGILVNNSTKEWQSALINLIENIDLRKKIVNSAQNDIKNNYSVKIMVNTWKNLIIGLLSEEKLEKFNETSLKLLTNPLFNQDYQTIISSDLFDENYYYIQNQDKIYHYLTIGVFEGCDPSMEFNSEMYAKLNNIVSPQINPFVYFIKKLENKFKSDVLDKKNISEICQNIRKTVSIIVPVYNAYDETKKCIESILNYTEDYELILINDKSTDKSINGLLNYYSNIPKVKIINNQNNLGFVASVNVGLKNSTNDVILLNSDTIVTPKWLKKLKIAAYSNEKIATVTPFSNNAGVFSVPNSNQENIILDESELLNNSNIIEKASNHIYLRVPTGNGFCMYIKRKTINSIGYFDEKTFGRGYGEENDFCMRAIEDGWENIIDDSTYIFHKDSSSFGDEKQKLIKQNMVLLNKKHPNYQIEVKNFINSKKFKNIRINISDALKDKNYNKKRVLYVSDKKENIIQNGCETYLLYVCDKLTLYNCFDNNLFKVKEWQNEFLDEICFNIIIKLSIDELFLNNFDLDNSKILGEYLQ